MIITRTPFRISFFGGSTDYPIWYKDNPGAVLSTTINKYCYIMTRYLPQFFAHKYRLRYRITEKKNKIEDIQHPTIKACLQYLNVDKGVEIVHTSDIPARSGVGSSSAFTVGFLHSLYALKGEIISKRRLASDAIHIEQDLIHENVGSQDQISCSFGGINKIEFNSDNIFRVNQLPFKSEIIDLLEKHIMMFFVGFHRTSSEIVSKYIKNFIKNKSILKSMYSMVDHSIDLLSNSEFEKFGKLLNESWQLKKRLSKYISNRSIDNIYNKAISAGAYGGKLIGSGGGGFLLLIVPEHKQYAINHIFKKNLHIPIKFDTIGSQIILYNESDF